MNILSQKEFEKLLREKLLRSGKYYPETPAQLRKTGKESANEEALPAFLTDPEALMARGYVSYGKLIEENVDMVNEQPNNYCMAARNGQEISEESMQKIIQLAKRQDEGKKSEE